MPIQYSFTVTEKSHGLVSFFCSRKVPNNSSAPPLLSETDAMLWMKTGLILGIECIRITYALCNYHDFAYKSPMSLGKKE